MRTIAIELVPPSLDHGEARAAEDAHKVVEHARACGMEGRIRHVLIPGMIPEDDDRPIEMRPRMDPLACWKTIQAELDPIAALCTQVTAFLDENRLTERLRDLRDAGVEGVVFVGVPRTMADGEGPGVAPTDALTRFRELVPNRGVVLIPTREGEHGRLNFKCERGATFVLTQLLYSDAIVGFLRRFAEQTPHRPDILLSFGHVPTAENRVQLIRWLIKDPGNEAVDKEQAVVADLAERPAEERKRRMVELYQRVVDGIYDLGFPLSVHLEAPYGFSMPAFETFAAMLDYWAPDRP